jgi:hypothetical protein
MAESINTGSYTLNLLILGVAIILVILAYQNIINTDPFVGKVPMTPIGNGPYFNTYYGIPPGVQPTGQPMMYPQQLYPQYPYYNDSVNQVGRPCNEQNGCGVLGACSNGVCTIKDQYDTVFDIKI